MVCDPCILDGCENGMSGVGNCPMTWEYWTSPEKVTI